MCKSAHAALEDLENKVAEARENTRGWATALGDVADGVNEQFPAKVREHCAITQRMLADAVDGMLEVEFLLRNSTRRTLQSILIHTSKSTIPTRTPPNKLGYLFSNRE